MEQLTYRMLHVQPVVSNMIKSVSVDDSALYLDDCDRAPDSERTL